MAVSRYDQRNNYEEAETNAIGTEYLRADLLSAAERLKVRELLKNTLISVCCFTLRATSQELVKIDSDTAELQNELWSAMKPQTAKDTSLVALAVAGMNDVLNSQGYTLAAWRNRIPIAAWGLMIAVAICCNLLIGKSAPERLADISNPSGHAVDNLFPDL